MIRTPAVAAQRNALIDASGSIGDVAPFPAFGQGLECSGAHVTVLTMANFGPAVASDRLAFESIGSQDACERAFADLAFWDPQHADASIDADQCCTSPALGAFARTALSDIGVPLLGVCLSPENFHADHSSSKLGLSPAWFAQGGENDSEAMLMTGFVPVDGQRERLDTLARLLDLLRQCPAPVTFTFALRSFSN